MDPSTSMGSRSFPDHGAGPALDLEAALAMAMVLEAALALSREAALTLAAALRQ